MQKICRNCKRLSTWILLVAQFLLITSYFYLKVDNIATSKVSFIKKSQHEEHPKRTYHTSEDNIFLKSVNTRAEFIDFNASLCYVNGSDLISMRRSKDNWQCKCLPGWHGKDCGQPEVIWRAFLTYRSPNRVSGPRAFGRRLIYLFSVDKFSETLAEIRINELSLIVDLFILYEPEQSDFLLNKLNSKFVEKHQHKILYIQEKQLGNFLELIRNIHNDDIIITSRRNEIPNKYAINFLKYYDKWPEPIRFRMRWSVFGFFWVHPAKTVITGGVCSVGFFKEALNSKINSLLDNKTLANPLFKGLILGDLNHFGGWFCEYCQDSLSIIEFLSGNPNSVQLEQIQERKIDGAFLEDIIENGLYIDGKTELIRARRYRDNYFAPYFVTENNWKYDYLMINFYSKIDYYEG